MQKKHRAKEWSEGRIKGKLWVRRSVETVANVWRVIEDQGFNVRVLCREGDSSIKHHIARFFEDGISIIKYFQNAF